jgi:hypothetical protein
MPRICWSIDQFGVSSFQLEQQKSNRSPNKDQKCLTAELAKFAFLERKTTTKQEESKASGLAENRGVSGSSPGLVIPFALRQYSRVECRVCVQRLQPRRQPSATVPCCSYVKLPPQIAEPGSLSSVGRNSRISPFQNPPTTSKPGARGGV